MSNLNKLQFLALLIFSWYVGTLMSEGVSKEMRYRGYILPENRKLMKGFVAWTWFVVLPAFGFAEGTSWLVKLFRAKKDD